MNPITLKREMEAEVVEIVKNLKKNSVAVSSHDEIEQIASISSNDPAIGKVIAEAMNSVGKNGVITMEEGTNFGVEKEVVDGMQFDKGYITPYMVTDKDSLKAEYSSVSILITDRKISSIHTMIPLLDKIAKAGERNLVIIAEDIEGDALATFVVNKLKGSFNVLGIKAPAFGDRRKEILEDIAIVTGGKFISEELFKTLDSVELTDLGRARKVISTNDSTIIVDGNGTADAVKERVNFIKKLAEQSTVDYEKEKFNERIAKLSGGVAVIKVGAATETELKEKKDRIEDALNATRAAVEEGISSGGGLALVLARPTSDETVGGAIVRKAIVEPLKIIASNAGYEGLDVLYNVLSSHKGGEVGIGFNALTGKYEDLKKAGIIDPTKVVRSALENAVSAASMFLTIEAVVADIPEDKIE
jgi:chaperonin GroEL